MPEPFLVFPWNRPFLPLLKRRMDSEEGIPLLVCPGSRPWHDLKELCLAEGRPRLLPRILTMKDLVARWYAGITQRHVPQANMLDCVHLLHEAARAAGAQAAGQEGLPLFGLEEETPDGEEQSLAARLDPASRHRSCARPLPLADMDMARFFPWGARLADLVEEMLAHGILPMDIPQVEGDVLPYAVELLERLGSIRKAYLEGLEGHNLTTEGLMSFTVARAIAEHPDLPIPRPFCPSPRTPVYIAGFHTLTRTQEIMLRCLWEAGAHVCLHTDPLVAGSRDAAGERRPVHWICRRHAQWMAQWKATAVLVEEDGADAAQAPATAQGEGPAISFLAGYDLHSQLAELAKDLAARDRSRSAAIVLPSPTLLMPVLHNLPREDRGHLDVTMGCPLCEAPVHQLLMDILALHAGRERTEETRPRYHWRRLLACLENPLVASLGLPGDRGAIEDATVGEAVRRCCLVLREGLRFVDPERDVLTHARFEERQTETDILRDIFACIIGGFDHISTTRGLARAMTGLCDFLRERLPQGVRERSAMDMEALHRMENTLVPLLADNLMADQPLPLPTLVSLLDGLLHREMLFFEPGEGGARDLQITGILESTLLHHDQVYILDATDDRVPGMKRRDPLLPDSLRAVIGLPDLNLGDQEIGYALHRLCANAGEVHFYWQEGVVRTYIFDGKKTRSRFVEEFLWQREQAQGHIITAGEPGSPLRIANASLAPLAPERRELRLGDDDAARHALDEVLAGTLSPSLLDDYLRCPVLFAFKRLANLDRLAEVNEDDDPQGVGTFIHKVLQLYHGRHMNASVADDREEAKRELLALFEDTLEAPDCQLRLTLPPESLAILRAAARRKLALYVDNQPRDARPRLLEAPVAARLTFAGREYTLGGLVDRLDSRDEGLVILDYKTGGVHQIGSALWEDDDFFARVGDVLQEESADAATRAELDALMARLRRDTASIQLPTYLAITGVAGGPRLGGSAAGGQWPAGTVGDAAFVELAKEGREISFCPARARAKPEERTARRQAALARCPLLVGLVLRHMATAERLVPCPGRQCANCTFAPLCRS